MAPSLRIIDGFTHRKCFHLKSGRTCREPGPRTPMKVIKLVFISVVAASAAFPQSLPPNVHAPWDALLKEFVNERHLVNYAHLKQDGWSKLNTYVARLGQARTQPLSQNEKKALPFAGTKLANLGNAGRGRCNVLAGSRNTCTSRPAMPSRGEMRLQTACPILLLPKYSWVTSNRGSLCRFTLNFYLARNARWLTNWRNICFPNAPNFSQSRGNGRHNRG